MKKTFKTFFCFYIFFFVISMSLHFANASNEQEKYVNPKFSDSLSKAGADVIFEKINSLRSKQGINTLSKITSTDCLDSFFESRLASLVDHISKYGPDSQYRHDDFGKNKNTLIFCEENKYRLISENTLNIPSGSSLDPVTMWTNSLSHKQTMFNKRFTHTKVIEFYDVKTKEIILIQLFFELR